jgi:hypothetical protein
MAQGAGMLAAWNGCAPCRRLPAGAVAALSAAGVTGLLAQPDLVTQ